MAPAPKQKNSASQVRVKASELEVSQELFGKKNVPKGTTVREARMSVVRGVNGDPDTDSWYGDWGDPSDPFGREKARSRKISIPEPPAVSKHANLGADVVLVMNKKSGEWVPSKRKPSDETSLFRRVPKAPTTPREPHLGRMPLSWIKEQTGLELDQIPGMDTLSRTEEGSKLSPSKRTSSTPGMLGVTLPLVSPRSGLKNFAEKVKMEKDKELEAIEVHRSLAQFEDRMNLNKEKNARSLHKMQAKQHWEELRNKMSMREMQLFYLKQSNLLRLLDGVEMSTIKRCWRQVEEEKRAKRSKRILPRVASTRRGPQDRPSSARTAKSSSMRDATEGMNGSQTVRDHKSSTIIARVKAQEEQEEMVALPQEELDAEMFRKFMTMLVPTYAFTRNELDYIFQVFDTDKSGDLSFVEFFSSLAVAMHHRDKDVNIQYVFHKLDPAGFGKVEKERFCDAERIVQRVLESSAAPPKSLPNWRAMAIHLAEVSKAYVQHVDFIDPDYVSLDEFRVMVYSHPDLLEDFEGLVDYA